MRLYHGSDVAITHPEVALNSGFADLGRGFYLTDDEDAARRRARSRARRNGAAQGVVSVFEFDEASVPWVCWGAQAPSLDADACAGPFGLRFDADPAGIAAWVAYIKACRAGHAQVGELGFPAVVRGWIATEEVEMVCAGYATPQDLAELVDPSELIVQYCFADQSVVDAHLRFVGSVVVA